MPVEDAPTPPCARISGSQRPTAGGRSETVERLTAEELAATRSRADAASREPSWWFTVDASAADVPRLLAHVEWLEDSRYRIAADRDNLQYACSLVQEMLNAEYADYEDVERANGYCQDILVDALTGTPITDPRQPAGEPDEGGERDA